MKRLWCLLVLAAAVTGCAHYHMGSGGTPTFSTLYIEPSANKTSLAQTQVQLSAMIREAFIKDGRVQVVNTPADADATLTVALVGYKRDNAANREDDTGLARKFTLKLTAICSLRDNRTGVMLLKDREIDVQREAFVDNGLGSVAFGTSNNQLQSETNTFPFLADQIADQLVHTVLDVW